MRTVNAFVTGGFDGACFSAMGSGLVVPTGRNCVPAGTVDGGPIRVVLFGSRVDADGRLILVTEEKLTTLEGRGRRMFLVFSGGNTLDPCEDITIASS